MHEASQDTRPSPGRNTVDRTHRAFMCSLVTLAGLIAALIGGSPTGSAAADGVLAFAAVAACVWASAAVPWWALTVAAAVAAGFASDLVSLAAAAAAGLAMAVAGAYRLRASYLRAGCGAVVSLALFRLEVPGAFGLESLTAIVTGGALIAIGTWRWSPSARRRGLIALSVVAGVAVVSGGAFATSAFTARSAFTSGHHEAQRGLDHLAVGDLDGALAEFDAAAGSFRRAGGLIDRPWTQPARIVPVVAQHRHASVEMAEGAAAASTRLVSTLATLDIDAGRLVDGHIDLDAIRSLEPRLLELQDTLDVLGEVLQRAESPWLLDVVQRRLRETTHVVDQRRAQGETALAAVRLMPEILGASKPRVYFLAFVTPSEIRGSLGFMGNFAEITIDAGRVEVTRFGRTRDLNLGGDPMRRRVTAMDDEFLSRYGRLGFTIGEGGRTARDIWQVITLSPHFPSVGEVIAELYPQSGGKELDGVLALDPTAVAALLQLTGPIDSDRIHRPITARSAAKFLLYDQYVELEHTPDRIDALEVLSEIAIGRILAGALPGPTELGRVFGPLVGKGHLAAWMAAPDRQTLVTTLGLGAALPSPAGALGAGLALNNGGGSKIDIFLDAQLRLDRAVDPATGRVHGTFEITMTNGAPAGGLPRYVIGNSLGLPEGTNRLLLAAYLPLPLDSASLDGPDIEAVDIAMTFDVEQDWIVMGYTVDIPPGGTRTLVMTFSGLVEPRDVVDRPDAGADPLFMITPNLAIPPDVTVVDRSTG